MGKHHGGKGTRLYTIWKRMKERCGNPNFHKYANYGGRGIAIDPSWLHDFAAFRAWALANGYEDRAEIKERLSIDRIDGNGGYTPRNCRWATFKQQATNSRSNTPVLRSDGRSFCTLADANYKTKGSSKHGIKSVCLGKLESHAGFGWAYIVVMEPS